MSEPRIFISAGEASGEHYGTRLVEALLARVPGADCFGLGGARMEQLGFRRIVKAEDVAVMGITEVVRHMPRIYAEFHKLKASLRRERPDVAILIDFPDVNLRLAEELHRLKVPVIYFVSPQLWAWKKRRIERVKKYVTRMLVIFPFEVEFYRGHGVQAEFVGHPLAEQALPTISREEFAAKFGYNLKPEKQWIALLPGSRRKQIELNLPEMLRAAKLLNAGETKYEFLIPWAPGIDRSIFPPLLKAHGSVGVPIHLGEDARAVLFHARASIVSSGTATVDAALIGNPFVVVYRLSRTSFAVARRVVDVPHVAMVNLVAGRRLVPELIQHDFTAVHVVEQLRPLLADGEARITMQKGLGDVRASLERPAASSLAMGTSSRSGTAGSTGTAIDAVAEIALSYTLSSMITPSRPVSVS
jgi:lipid-A-disaccharide synthase